jgi:hypothetical protein
MAAASRGSSHEPDLNLISTARLEWICFSWASLVLLVTLPGIVTQSTAEHRGVRCNATKLQPDHDTNRGDAYLSQ